MRPANAGIGARNHDSLAGETECPNLRRVRVIDARLDRLRTLRLRRRFILDPVEEGHFERCGLPSTRATSGRAANASAISRVPFTKIAFTM